MEYNSSIKSDLNTQNNDDLSNLPDKEYLQDCNSTERLTKIDKGDKLISFKRNGEKYFPHFKARVISHALKHSIKNAALTFKVSKDTVSSWVHQSKSTLENKNCKIITALLEDESSPDYKFIEWLRTTEKQRINSRQLLTDKVNELVASCGEQKPDKKKLWFFLYAKRLKDVKSVDKVQIKYPYLFKQEVINYTKHFSKKKTSQIFNIDRKRICEWTNDFNNDKLKKRDVSKYLTDPEVDSKIWEWYSLQENKPTSKEVRLKAAHLYEEAGLPQIRCSPGWYYRWRVRHHLPPVRMSQASRDSEILTWVLQQIDENKSVGHSDLLKQAATFKGSDFKASSSWVFKFTRRYISHIQSGSENICLPEKLSEQVVSFKKLLSTAIQKNNIRPANIIAFDELPLNFFYSESSQNESIMGKSDWANCQASVILSCSAEGFLFPTGLIVRGPTDETISESEGVKPFFAQESGINYEDTIEEWFKNTVGFFGNPSVLICDTFKPHKDIKTVYSDELSKKNIEIMIIPGGCSSHLQPILFGIGKRFKVEIDNCFEKWQHESRLSGMMNTSLPSNNEIYKWVQKAHYTLSFSYKDLIKLSFVKTGIISEY